MVDGQTAAGSHVDLLTGLPPALDLGPGEKKQNPLLRAYFANVSRANRAIYLPGLRDYVTHLADRRLATERVNTFTIDWLEAAIPTPPGAAETTPTDGVEALVPRRKLVSRP